MSGKTDIWMPLYIADYLADTTSLDAERSGAYLHLLMEYWRFGPLEDNLDDLVRTAKLHGENARSIAEALLRKYFTLGEDGFWHQKRSDRELTKWCEKRMKAKEKARKAAEERWNKTCLK